MSISGKKMIGCTAIVAALSLVCVGAFKPAQSPDMTVSASASTEETETRLKVFTGDIDRAPEGYVQQRTAYINNAAKARSSEVMEAVIGLDDYYTVDEITALADDYDIVINRTYMWPEGETGRLALYVEDNDIESSIEAYKLEVEENGYCEQNEPFAANYQRFLDGEYEIFALTVTGSAQALEELITTADCISYVDVKYNTEVETYAESVGKTVSYIELPSKPDGAL